MSSVLQRRAVLLRYTPLYLVLCNAYIVRSTAYGVSREPRAGSWAPSNRLLCQLFLTFACLLSFVCSVQCTAIFVSCTPYIVQYLIHNTPSIVQSTPCSLHNTLLHHEHFIVHNTHCTRLLNNTLCSARSSFKIVYSFLVPYLPNFVFWLIQSMVTPTIFCGFITDFLEN